MSDNNFDLEHLFKYVLKKYREDTSGKVNKNTDIYDYVVRKIPSLISKKLNDKNIKVDGSIGKGNRTRFPWIAILDRTHTETEQEGIYMCYLFKKDMSGFYLTLTQGVTNFEKFGKRKAEVLNEVTKYYQDEIDSKDFKTSRISLGARKGEIGHKYERATILSKMYDVSNWNEDELEKDLNKMFDIYKDVIKCFDTYKYDDIIQRIIQTDPYINGSEALQKTKEVFETNGVEFNEINKDLIEVYPKADRNTKFKKITNNIPKKIDYFKKAQQDAINGSKGEMLCIKYEQRKLQGLGRPDLAEKVKQVSILADGYGYDIISYDLDKNGKEYEIFIEVKTTKNKIDTEFFISKNEIDKSKELKENYCLFRIYDLKGEQPKFYKAYGKIDDNFIINPITFVAKYKY